MQSVVNFHKQPGFKQIVFFFSDQAEAEKKANASQRREDSVPTTAAETIKPELAARRANHSNYSSAPSAPNPSPSRSIYDVTSG